MTYQIQAKLFKLQRAKDILWKDFRIPSTLTDNSAGKWKLIIETRDLSELGALQHAADVIEEQYEDFEPGF